MRERPLLVTAVAILALILLVFPAPLANVSAQSTPVTAGEVLSAVNNLRTANSLSALQQNAALITAAQNHAAYMASIHSTTHTESGGTDETDRALAAGYGANASITCDESVAKAQMATPIDYVVNTIWGDNQNRNLVLLNSKYTDAGAGVAVASDSSIYYALVACSTLSSPSGVKTGTATPSSGALSRKTPETEVTIVTVTPRENGSMIHVVATGESLWSIANAYGKTIDQLEILNNLATKEAIIYVGQQLLVRPAFTATPTPTITLTPRPPTRTSRPTFTPGTNRPGGTATSMPTPTRTIPMFSAKTGRRWLGLGLVILCVLGLLSVLASHPHARARTRESGSQESPEDKQK